MTTNTPTIEEICAIRDPILRNLWITQTYHTLGTRLAEQGLAPDATWLFFAVWASKTAGRIIRGDELPGWLRQEIESSVTVKRAVHGVNRRWTFIRVLGAVDGLGEEHLIRLMRRTCDHVSEQIAAGNRLVFSELAPVFEALAAGRPSPPVRGLKRVVERYRDALNERDENRRSLLVLQANVIAVAHEQHRLQRYIASSMRPPLDEFLTKMVDRELAHWVPGWLARKVADACLHELRKEITRIWQEATTVFMMKLVTADETLILHEALPPPPPGPDMFPPALVGEAAMSAVHPWDLTGGRGNPCGADDWTMIRQRMCYIVNLFRSRQRHPALASPPFTQEQLEAMVDRRIPAGPL